jgi:hypothetical protein
VASEIKKTSLTSGMRPGGRHDSSSSSGRHKTNEELVGEGFTMLRHASSVVFKLESTEIMPCSLSSWWMNDNRLVAGVLSVAVTVDGGWGPFEAVIKFGFKRNPSVENHPAADDANATSRWLANCFWYIVLKVYANDCEVSTESTFSLR